MAAAAIMTTLTMRRPVVEKENLVDTEESVSPETRCVRVDRCVSVYVVLRCLCECVCCGVRCMLCCACTFVYVYVCCVSMYVALEHMKYVFSSLTHSKHKQTHIIIINSPNRDLVYFRNCNGSNLTVSTKCAKVIVESCTNCTITVAAGTVSGMVELLKSDAVTAVFTDNVPTISLDTVSVCVRVCL